MVDYLGDVTLARALSGHPSDLEVTPSQMIEGMKYGHQQLMLFSNRDWDTNTPLLNQLQRIEEHFCASWVKSWWRDPDNKSQELYNRAKGMIVALMENLPMSGTSGPSYTSTAYRYRTAALNQNAMRYRSPRTDI